MTDLSSIGALRTSWKKLDPDSLSRLEGVRLAAIARESFKRNRGENPWQIKSQTL